MKIIYLLIGFTLAFGLSTRVLSQTIPTYTIGQVRGDNSFEGGGADSNNVKCKLVGVVYGLNQGVTGNRIQFALRDATGCIGIFKNTNDLPFQISQGDSVRVIGLVNNFNGLSQITIDSAVRLGQNLPLKEPEVFPTLGEDTESKLVKLEGFTLSNPASWPAVPSGSGFTVKIKRNNVEVDLRIDNDCNLFGAPAPVGFFNVVGLGGQFDNSVPKNSGYQLLPRSTDDITAGSPPPVPTVSFTSKTLQVQENAGLVQIPLQISIPSNEQLVVQVVPVDSNATLTTDYSIGQSGQVTFPANFGANQSLNLTITDDLLVEGLEKFKLIIRKISGGGNLEIGLDSVLTVSIIDNETPITQLPTYTIALIRGNNSVDGGVADSINVSCKITGTLYGYNLRGTNNGLQFTIRDATGGINIFSASNNFGLSLQEGDSVRAIGKIGQFNGLSQLNLDSIVLLATGRTLQSPQMVDSLSEATESNLIYVEGYSPVNLAQWTPGVGTGFTVQITNGTRTIDVRIDNDSELFNYSFPTTFPQFGIRFTGLGGQFDNSIPRTSGFQLIPRKISDIFINVSVSGRNTAARWSAYPNPANRAWKISGIDPTETIELVVINSLGQKIFSAKGSKQSVENDLELKWPEISKGVFVLRLTTNGIFSSKTVIKN